MGTDFGSSSSRLCDTQRKSRRGKTDVTSVAPPKPEASKPSNTGIDVEATWTVQLPRKNSSSFNPQKRQPAPSRRGSASVECQRKLPVQKIQVIDSLHAETDNLCKA